MIVDLFAGPGGWDEALRLLGRTDVIGVEWDAAACATAEAAGHHRVQADVAALDPLPFTVGAAVCDLLGIDVVDAIVEGLIASPPCQAWSMAGKRKGELDRANCHRLADRMAAGDDSLDWTEWEDDRSPLVCQPIRWARELRPTWIALEEVPAVASLWEHFAIILRGWGYHVWTGDLLAADYGVPQTRTRRILIAHRDRLVRPPAPTHARFPAADLFGGELLPWISMGEALGWGFDDEPAATVTTGGGSAGGVEVFGNAAYRARLRSYVVDRRTNSKAAGGRMEPTAVVTLDRPAPTLTGKAGIQWVIGPAELTERNVRLRVAECGVLQSFRPDYPWTGSREKQHEQVGNAVPPLLAAATLREVL